MLDELLSQQQQQGAQAANSGIQGKGLMTAPSMPSWPTVFLAISLFVLQYRLSGLLEVPLLGEPDNIMFLPQRFLPAPYFCARLYWLRDSSDGVMGHAPAGYPGLTDAILLAYGVAVWRSLDGTPQGLAISCLTAAAGPAVEVLLINILGLYAYTHPQVDLRAVFLDLD